MPSSAEKVLEYLEELHGLETHLVSTLTAHIAMTPRSAYRDILERHRYETRTQAQRIEQRLAELGQSGSLIHVVSGAVQDAVGQGMALVLAPLNVFRGAGGEEKLLRNARDEAASEALEIASYDALEAVADAVGDPKTAVLAREHRIQEETFLADLRELIPGLATDVVDAEVEGHRHYDPMTTGAADTVRKATRTVAALSRNLRRQPETAAEPASAAGRDVAEDVTAAAQDTGAAQAAARVEEVVRGAELDDDLAIADYDSLSVEQLLPKLKTLSTEELAAVDGYERGGRSRKRVLNRIAALRSKKIDKQLAKT
ncbi:MAG: DUF892 family protein [Actinomycetota bacterium]|nr:DUF892 family protein [Actinomycetota bacterium]